MQFMNLTLLEAPPWSLRAAFLLWLTHLRAEQHDKSYDLADFIFARFPCEKFSEIRAGERTAEAIPYSWRNEIFERLPAGYNRDSGRPSGEAEEILDKTEKCYVMLDCSAFERRRIHHAFLIDLHGAGQLQRALKYCRPQVALPRCLAVLVGGAKPASYPKRS